MISLELNELLNKPFTLPFGQASQQHMSAFWQNLIPKVLPAPLIFIALNAKPNCSNIVRAAKAH